MISGSVERFSRLSLSVMRSVPEESGYVGANARALAGRVYFVDFRRGDSVGAGQAQDGIADGGVRELGVLVEERRDEHREDHREECVQDEAGDGSPDVPGARQAANDSEEGGDG